MFKNPENWFPDLFFAKAHMLGTRVEGDHEYLTDQTIAGDVCEIERPPIDEELESEPLRGIRHIVAEEGGEDGT